MKSRSLWRIRRRKRQILNKWSNLSMISSFRRWIWSCRVSIKKLVRWMNSITRTPKTSRRDCQSRSTMSSSCRKRSRLRKIKLRRRRFNSPRRLRRYSGRVLRARSYLPWSRMKRRSSLTWTASWGRPAKRLWGNRRRRALPKRRFCRCRSRRWRSRLRLKRGRSKRRKLRSKRWIRRWNRRKRKWLARRRSMRSKNSEKLKKSDDSNSLRGWRWTRRSRRWKSKWPSKSKSRRLLSKDKKNRGRSMKPRWRHWRSRRSRNCWYSPTSLTSEE